MHTLPRRTARLGRPGPRVFPLIAALALKIRALREAGHGTDLFANPHLARDTGLSEALAAPPWMQ